MIRLFFIRLNQLISYPVIQMYEKQSKEKASEQPLDRPIRFSTSQNQADRISKFHRKRLTAAQLDEKFSFSDSMRIIVEKGLAAAEKEVSNV